MGGSSPLTRGKQLIGNVSAGAAGIIPAHAGKTAASGAAPTRAGDHPRSRGENSLGLVTMQPKKGSSPLTRGKHCIDGPAAQGAGIIPAHAGKTYRLSH